jgi:hypothetical protein
VRALAILAAAGLAAVAATSFAAGASRHRSDGWQGNRQDVKHIFVIVLENHSQHSVIGDRYTPYISSLATDYASAANYYGVTHPSEPNYLAMISGSNWWLNQDDASFMVDHTNLVDELEAAHKTWAAYEEAMPADDKTAQFWPSSKNALYANKHNPFVHFTDVVNDPARMADIKPYTSFASDLASERTTPNFSFIVPDQCNDMHGGVYTAVPGHPETPCPYNDVNDDPADQLLKKNADTFVKSTVQTIMASPSWHDGQDAIFVVSDEGDFAVNPTDGNWDSTAGCCDSPVLPAGDPDISPPGTMPPWPGGVYGGGLVPAVVVVNHGGKTGGYVSQTPYNHYSLLATIETVWHLPLLAYAADTAQVTPMTEFLTK